MLLTRFVPISTALMTASLKTRLTTLLSLSFLWSLSCSSAEPDLVDVSDFKAVALEIQQQQRPLLLTVYSEHCGYCQQLKKSYLLPMLKDSAAASQPLLRQLELRDDLLINNFDGSSITASAFARSYGVYVVPTVLFLDAQGKSIAEPLVGFANLDFYGAYLERSITQAKQALQASGGAVPQKDGASSDAPSK